MFNNALYVFILIHLCHCLASIICCVVGDNCGTIYHMAKKSSNDNLFVENICQLKSSDLLPVLPDLLCYVPVYNNWSSANHDESF